MLRTLQIADDFIQEGLIHQGTKSQILRGRLHRCGTPAILKMPRVKHPSAADFARYQHEFRVLSRLDARGIRKPLFLDERQGRPRLVLADIDAESLGHVMSRRRLSIVEAVHILLQAANILHSIHTSRVVHLQVHPWNWLWSQTKGELHLIDFAGSRCLDEDPQSRDFVSLCEYISPEQTGLLAQEIDARSDLYSLGIMAWHLLTGNPPFQASTEQKLCHAHLAQQAAPLHLRNPEVPECLSNIVESLLEKHPAARLQSAKHLRVELQHCLARLVQEQHQVVDSIHRPGDESLPSTRLYGRETQLDLMLSAIRFQESACFLVSGPAGIGKSTLVEHLRSSFEELGGHFSAGSCSALEESSYEGFKSAVSALLRRILSQEERRRLYWQKQLSQLPCEDHPFLQHHFPELDYFLGRGEKISAEFPAQGALFNAKTIFIKLLRVLANVEHQLFLFVDNLQWADEASLQLVIDIIEGERIPGLFLAGAYRDENQERGSTSLRRLDSLVENEAPLLQLHLAPLNRNEIARMLHEVRMCSAERACAIADIVWRKTGGNPLFVQALWSDWQARGLPCGDDEQWQLIESLPIAGNIVDFLSQGLKRREHGLTLLQCAACFGSAFSADELCALLPDMAKNVERELAQCVVDNILQVVEDSASGQKRYQFTHHRIREAAYSLLDEQEKSKMHYAIGMMLLHQYQSSPQKQPAPLLFGILRHLRKCLCELEPLALRTTCAGLALKAGEIARDNASIDEAFHFFQWGFSLLGKEPWKDSYDLALACSSAIINMGFFMKPNEVIEHHIQELLQHGKSLADKVPAHEGKVLQRILSDRNHEALGAANVFLQEAGAPQMRPRSLLTLLWELPYTFWMLKGKSPEMLLSLPKATDPVKKGIVNIQIAVIPAYLAICPRITTHAILRDIRAALRLGTTGPGSLCWTGYAALSALLFGKQDSAESFGQVALAQIQRFRRYDLWPKTSLFYHSLIFSLYRPLTELILPLKEVYKSALEQGDQHAATGAQVVSLYVHFATGTPLDVQALLLRQSTLAKTPNPNQYASYFESLWSQMINALHLEEEHAEEDTPYPTHEGMGSKQLRAMITLFHHLIFGQTHKGFRFALNELTLQDNTVLSIYNGPIWTYALVSLYAGLERGQRVGFKGRCRILMGTQILKRWVNRCPGSRQYRLSWVQAAKYRSQGHALKALEAYDHAITEAHDGGFVHDAALIAEQASALCETQRRFPLAQHYRDQSIEWYQQWGAWRKVSLMKRTHPTPHNLLPPSPSAPSSRERQDLIASLSASQALLHGKDFQELLFRVIPILLHNSGAQRLLVLTKQEQEWMLRAEGTEDNIQIHETAFSLERTKHITLNSALRFVSLTRETLILHDARSKGSFVNEPYVLRSKMRSFCCLPLLLQDELQGLLVLENTLLPNVFTEDRVALLQGLSAVLVAGSSISAAGKNETTRNARHTPSILATISPSSHLTQQSTSYPSPFELPAHPHSLNGQLIGQWRLIRLIGQGGMAAVYEARNIETNQRAAVKMLLSSIKESSQIQRFEREARALRQMEHPSIVKLLDFDCDPIFGYYLAMEYLEGKPLSYLIDRYAPLPVSWMLEVNAQLCAALQAIHDEGMIHRDLKPSNVFISQGEAGPQVKLLDFGIAKSSFHEKQTRLTSTGAIIGTPAYVSPEQLKERVTLTPAADLFSLGVIWFEALTGKTPLHGGSNIELFVKILQSAPAPIGSLRPEFKASPLEDLLSQLFSKQPLMRPQSAAITLDEFEIACQFLDDPFEQESKLQQLDEALRSSNQELVFP